MGRADEALAEREKALRLDPLSPIITSELGFSYLFARKYDRAVEEFHKAAELYPDFAPAHDFLAHAYELSGLYDQATAECEKAIALSNEGYIQIHLARIYALFGRRLAAKESLAEINARSKSTHYSPLMLASVYTAMGEKDEAFEWLDKAYDQREPALVQIRVNPTFDSLRSDPRFGDLLKRMNLL